jgi:TolB-like protein/Flp pilus assembly protein TadD
VVMGTASYMSPEQVEGKPVDHRSDIFSLGIVFYEMATGRSPFQGDSSVAVMSSILRDQPQPLMTVRTDLPRHLSRLVMQCLEKSPQDRFQSARDVYNELRNLHREVVSDLERSSGRKPPTAVQAPAKRVGTWVLGALLAIAGLAVGAWWLVDRRTTGREQVAEEPALEATSERKLVAVLPLRNLGPAEDEYFAAGITDEIISRLATVRGLGVISSGSTVAYRDTDVPAKEIGEELGVDYVLSGSVRWARQTEGPSRVRISPRLVRVGDDIHLWAEVYERSMNDIFEIQSEIALKVAAELGATLLEPGALESRPTQNQAAYQAYLRGRSATQWTSCEALRPRIDDLHRAVELDSGFVQAWVVLSMAYSAAFAHCAEHRIDDRAEALRALERAKQLAPGSWQVLEAEGQFLTRVERDYERALEPLQEANRLVDNSEIHHSLGRIYRRMGRWDEALAEAERALQLDPLNPDHYMRLAAVLHWMRDYPRAIEYYDRSIELVPEADNMYVRKAWVHWLWEGGTAEARSALETLPVSELSDELQWGWYWQRVYEGRFEEALQGLDLLPDDRLIQNIFVAPKSLLIAQAYRLMGERELAQAAFEESVRILKGEVEKYPSEANYWQALAIAYAGSGHREPALEAASRATELLPIDREPYFGGSSLLEVALVHTMLGQYDTAIEELDTLLAMPNVVSIPWLQLDPRWARLWDHPGFQELVEKYG